MSSLQIPTADYVRLVKTFPNQQRLQAGHPYWQSYGPGWRGFFFARGIASKIIFTKSKISRFQRLITSWQDVSWFKARWRLDSTKEELSFDVIFLGPMTTLKQHGNSAKRKWKSNMKSACPVGNLCSFGILIWCRMRMSLVPLHNYIDSLRYPAKYFWQRAKSVIFNNL